MRLLASEWHIQLRGVAREGGFLRGTGTPLGGKMAGGEYRAEK